MFDSCIYGDDELADIYTVTEPRARKQHRCCECRAAILRGQRYQRDTGKFNGEFFTFATCLTCARIAASLVRGPIAGGTLWERIHEAYCDDDEEICICP